MPVEGELPLPLSVKITGGFEVSQDGAHLASPASDPADRKGVAIHRLQGERAGSVAAFFATGEVQVEFWLDATHVVATNPKGLWVLDLESGKGKELPGLRGPIATPDRARVIALDERSRPVILEGSDLSRRVTVEVELGEEALIQLAAENTLILATGQARSVVVSLGGVVKLELPAGGSADDQTGLSARGNYLTRLVSVEAVAALALFEVATGKEIYRADPSFYPGAITVSKDETMAVASNEPSSGVRVELPSGKTRSLLGGKWESEAYSHITRRLGITEDGRFVCGHPVTTIGKYTNCNSEILFSLGGSAKPRAAYVGCHVSSDGSATLVKIPAGSVGAARGVIPNLSATYTKLCNSSISADHSLIALAVAPDKQAADSMRYDDVELLVVRVADGSVERSFALGSGPSSMGAVLNHEFSPTGRFVRVEWGEGMIRVFDRTTGALLPGAITFEPTDTVFALNATELVVAGRSEPVPLALMEGSMLYPRHPL